MSDPARRTRLATFVVAIAVLVAAPLAVVASDAFTDVPGSNVHHDDITWLADNGITLGCNPPDNDEFCPDDAVLRQQMASFMRRLAENQIVDAATVDGRTTSEIASATGTSGASADQFFVPFETAITVEEITVDAPTDGFLLVHADASYRSPTQMRVIQWLQLDDTTCEPITSKTGSVDLSYASLASDADRQTAVNSALVEVAEGQHTLTLCVRTADGPGDTAVLSGTSLNAVFYATGSTEEPLLDEL